MPASNENTYYFLARNGKVYQINGVTEITFGSPLIANGQYRDSPPTVPGGGAVAAADQADSNVQAVSAQMGGGVDPVVTTDGIGTFGFYAAITGKSSVEEDDAFQHVELRYVFFPMFMVFFTTDAGIATAPDGTSFPTERPDVPPATGGHFEVFNVDCCFPFNEDCGIFNAPPPGWIPTDSR